MTTDRKIELLTRIKRYGFGMLETANWGLSDHQAELATRSAVYRELMRPDGDSPAYGRLHSITSLWEAAGRPAELEPRAYMKENLACHAERLAEAKAHPDPDMVKIVGELTVEDRGEAGIFADWDAAVWYAQELDPEAITIDKALELSC